MGKRKERRLAALIGAGRRVKLDLFAEPSGDLGGSPAEEVEGGVETKLEAGLPKSPSSSDCQQPANPLLLLGQYSDDDMEEGSSDDNRAHQDTTQAENDEQVKSNGKELEESTAASSEEPLAEKTSDLDVEKDAATSGSLQGLGNNNVGENIAAVLNDVSNEKHPEPLQNSVPLASDIEVTGDDLKSWWKMVLHEESNGYYYWNTVTGETSWEVPAEFAQGAAPLMPEPQISVAEDNAHRALYASGVTESADDVSYSLFPSASLVTQSIQECKGDESQLISSSGAFHQENLTLGNYSSYVPPTVPVVGSWVGTSGASSIYMHGGMTNNQDEAAVFDLPSQLVRRSESLLEKLRSLRGSEGNSNEQHAWTSKYIAEIEIRLFDLNSLLSYGSSVAHFWLHSETQLKRLEDAVNSEIGSYVESELKNETNSVLLPLDDGRAEKQENREGEADLGKILKTGVLSSGKSCNVLDDVKLPTDVQNSLLDVASCDGIPNIKQGPALANDMTRVGEEENISNEATVLANVNLEPEPHPVEEEDMDIDMEVEDTSLPSDATATETVYSHTYPSEHLCQPSASADKQSLASEVESVAPPPPDDDWIPPPPPDNEEIPPPPPDEPPESFCVPPPPSYTQAVETLTYPASYSLLYPDPNYSYYGHAGVTLPNQPVYYETVPSSHAEAAGTLNNHVGSAVYYVQDSAAPVVSAEAPASFHVALAPSGCDGISSNLAGTDCAQVQMASFQNSNADRYALHGGAGPITSQPSNTSISAAACAATQESILASHASTSASSAAFIAPLTVDPSIAAAKPPPKASRVKKRTVAVASSLKSNKKVSSLVDKWKAAKEEMQEAEEEEDEDALIILEKKRQREIEEWRAQQIASGEARDNANFQPLGGDWRERVKRKRARRAASAETPAEETVAEKKQPDSSEHSRGLPPGWQAYWDESSKQVYYGNTVTSETTWTRPT